MRSSTVRFAANKRSKYATTLSVLSPSIQSPLSLLASADISTKPTGIMPQLTEKLTLLANLAHDVATHSTGIE